MTPEAASAYAQVLSLGLVWVTFHCAGMCGPLVVGLDVSGACRGVPLARGAGNILLYQAGRGLTYTALGAAAGLVGAGARATLETGGALLALLGAAAIVVVVVRRLWPNKRATLVQIGAPAGKQPGFLEASLLRLAQALLPADSSPALRAGSLGVLMGFLPCMLTTWVLSLAAVTASPLHGAGVMLTLVALTTPVLLGVSLVPRVLGDRLKRYGGKVAPALLLVSAGWLVMVALAGLGVVPHEHLTFEVLGRGFMLMLW